ncbi:MAG: hypothetical protein GF364_17295 [Candidatus Lokiarchaeota archaeon]|nr:hypothetical protein [Candidatus Lokiarchaeota archaeon]
MKFRHLDRVLIPAIPTWFSKQENGYILDMEQNQNYIRSILNTPVGGVAALVHTGRGNFLYKEEKETYLKYCVEIAHNQSKVVITGVNNIDDARMAKNIGIDAVLIFPNRHELKTLHDPERSKKIYEYHKKICQIHGNGIIFLLYEATGIGIVYNSKELKRLLSIPEICGIKFALLSNFEKLEDMLAYLYQNKVNTSIFTGEDRMFAESIEKARDFVIKTECNMRVNSLIGLGQALPYIQSFMLKTFDHPQYQADYFIARSIISDLARHTFVRPRRDASEACYDLPMEPYIQNMGEATKLQFNLKENLIADIATIKTEQKARNIPKLICNSLKSFNFTENKSQIEKIMVDGLKFEEDLRKKYGKNLEKINVQ